MTNILFPVMIITTGVVSILNLGLGLFILFFSYIRNLMLDSEDNSALWFAILQFILSSWGFVMLFMIFALQSGSLIYVTLLALGTVVLLIPAIFMIFVLNYTQNPYRNNRAKVVIATFGVMLLWMLIPNLGLVSFVSLEPIIRVQSPFYVMMGLYVSLMTFMGVYDLIRVSLKKKGEESMQFRLVALSVGASGGVGGWGFAMVYFTQNALYAFTGPIATILVTVTTTYLITQHGFFHIKKLYSEMLIIIGLMTMVIFIEISISVIFGDSIQVAETALIAMIFVVISSIMIRLTYQSLAGEYSLEKLESDLEDLIEDKNTFLKISSHQLRTPLTAIAGYLERVEDEQDRYPAGEETMVMVDKMRQITTGLQGTVNDLLSINSINSGEFAIVPNQFHDLAKLIDQIVLNKEFFFNSHNTKVRTIFRGEDFCAEVDYYKIRETLNNLIDNAVYYGKSKVTIALIDKTNTIEIVISDDGIGFDEETRKKFFKRFSRTTQTQKINPNGSGLGLYLGNLIISKHNGTIDAKSKGPGHGSQFIIEIPKKQPTKDTTEAV
jgi:signal transduction histidine kinase